MIHITMMVSRLNQDNQYIFRKIPKADQQIMALDSMSSPTPPVKDLTKYNNDDVFFNSIPVPKPISDNPPTGKYMHKEACTCYNYDK